MTRRESRPAARVPGWIRRLPAGLPLAWTGRRRTEGGLGELEGLVQRAAALLRGGVPASRLWRVLAEGEAGEETGGSPEDPARAGGADALRRLLASLERGADSADALAAVGAPEWRVLAAAWRIAETSGAPFASTLDRFAHASRALARVSERRAVLLAGPRATIRLVGALPPVALGLGALLGFDPVPVLSGPVGAAVMGCGALLLVLGVRWAQTLTARVARADWIAGWEFELVAIALGGGAPPGSALRVTADCADRARAGWVRLEELAPRGSVVRAIDSAESMGAPVVPLLLGEAERRRDRAQAGLERAAERLGVSVLIPLGVCVLPAFVLLGVVPVLLAVLAGTGW